MVIGNLKPSPRYLVIYSLYIRQGELYLIPNSSRIPVDSNYLQAVGQVAYNFATVEWNVVYLGSLISPSFLARESGTDFNVVSREFTLLSALEGFLTCRILLKDSLKQPRCGRT